MERIINIQRKGEDETKSIMNKEAKNGTAPYTVDSVLFLGKFTTNSPIISVAMIYVRPIRRLFTPKL